jgi:hypothetical protein
LQPLKSFDTDDWKEEKALPFMAARLEDDVCSLARDLYRDL